MIRIRLLFVWAKGIIAVATWTALRTLEHEDREIPWTHGNSIHAQNSLKKLCSLSLLLL